MLDYALSGLAKEFRRLLLTNWQQHRKVLGQSDKRRSQRRLRALLSKAFAATLLSASDSAFEKQRHVLIYILAAASLPETLATFGLPAELKRLRRQRGRR
ncbi:hypothetical protein [Caballeronia sp. 15711]|uniref:hypothetical protein n=1 Tax=Caballeronia sp. 15711 TaxID=3391029 RepID=UPI0039E2CC19